MPLISLKVDPSSFSVVKWLNSFDDAATNPDIWANGIRLMGNDFAHNFDKQGAFLAGSWQPLSAYTRKKREERGYPPARPILQQSGRLREMAAGRFQDWRPYSFRGYMMSDANQGYESDGVTTMTANVVNNTFTATMTGPKVSNQIGGSSPVADYFAGFSGSGRRGRGYIPARPFWMLNQDMVEKMGDAMLDRIMLDWQSKDRKHTTRDYYYRAAYLDTGTKKRRR